MLADLISKALSTPSTNVSIGAVDGVLSSDVSISDVVLSDRDGPWLKIDKIRLVWSRLALLKRRLEVDQLTIGHMQFLRRPAPSQAAQPPPDATAPQSILPELPVKVIVKQFAVQELSIGEAGPWRRGAPQPRGQGDARAAVRGSRSASRRRTP